MGDIEKCEEQHTKGSESDSVAHQPPTLVNTGLDKTISWREGMMEWMLGVIGCLSSLGP